MEAHTHTWLAKQKTYILTEDSKWVLTYWVSYKIGQGLFFLGGGGGAKEVFATHTLYFILAVTHSRNCNRLIHVL